MFRSFQARLAGYFQSAPALAPAPDPPPRLRPRMVSHRPMKRLRPSLPPAPPGLTSLPDNVLVRILDKLSAAPRPGEMSGRALTSARDAHALAATCRAFYALFRNHAFRAVVFDYSAAVVVSSTRGGRHEKQLAAIMAFAGKSVRSLVVGGCYEGGFGDLFNVIISKCPSLVSIEIADSDYEFDFGEGLMRLLRSRAWESLRLPMAMRSTMSVAPMPSPSEPDSKFLINYIARGCSGCGKAKGGGEPGGGLAAGGDVMEDTVVPSSSAAFLTAGSGPAAGVSSEPVFHLAALKCIAFPTRLPSCSPAAINRFWDALPNLRVLSLSADLPPSVLAHLPIACPYLVELRLNLLGRGCDDNYVLRHHLNAVYTDLFKAYAGTLESVLLGWFDLDLEFVSDLVTNCTLLTSVDLRDCRDLSGEMLRLFGHRLVGIRDTPLDAAAMVALSTFAKNLSFCEFTVDEGVHQDLTDPAVDWAASMGNHVALRHLVIKGPREPGITVDWERVLNTLKDSLVETPAVLSSFRIERVRTLNDDVWQGLLSAVGRSLTSVSAFESAPITALQFISSVSLFCPRVERIRLPRLYYGEEEELYDAISELMALEAKVPFVCVSALRNYTDYVFTFLRRGGLEWTIDEHQA